ncbi:MAG: hypothetical protein EXS35_17585 [Pedosphaera sp.]|nr:hypothetical protein [Pedosphaera sp.]
MRSKLWCLFGVVLGLNGLSLRAATFQVQMKDYYFTPTNINISVGDTIQWTNAASVNAHDTSSTNAAMLWGSGDLAAHATYSVTFTNAGDFFYVCNKHFFAFMNPHREQTGHVIVASANLPPSVNLTNPPNNARFRAPASFLLQASANDTDGSVTNVQFFSGAALLGSATIAPYFFPANNLAAGNYNFTARATDNSGNTSTSAVVSVFVLTNAVLQNPVRLANGQFKMTILGIAGQTYATESSTNLTNWAAFATNVAPANSFNVTDFTSTNLLFRFYRARQDL